MFVDAYCVQACYLLVFKIYKSIVHAFIVYPPKFVHAFKCLMLMSWLLTLNGVNGGGKYMDQLFLCLRIVREVV